MYLILLQSQTAAGAAFEIIFMLAGAAIIGIVATYLYCKSKFLKEILFLKAELEKAVKSNSGLHKKIFELKSENSLKNEQLDLLEREFELLQNDNEKLKKVYEASKTLYIKAVDEIENTNTKLHAKENELTEKDAVLMRIANRKHLLDYDGFGRARKNLKDNLQMISGIGPFIEEKLNILDIFIFEQISKFSNNDIETINEAIEFFPGRIERDEWVPQAQELVYSGGKKTALFERMKLKKHKIDYTKIGIAHREDAQDLSQIHGIGPFIQDKLNFLDIYTFEQISKFTPQDVETITDIIEFFPGRIDRDSWVDQAKNLMSKVEMVE